MIIEIGTSDFRTKAGLVDGVFIEPVKYYFDRMVEMANNTTGLITFRDKPKCFYENLAISDYEGEANIYSVTTDNILSMGAPKWMRGCNSIGKPHPSVISWCQAHSIDASEYTHKETVKVVRIKSIIDKYNITEIDLLKIDTEGHDCIIVNDYINTVDILPRIIQFENNELSDPNEVAKVVARLKQLKYNCKQVNFDMVCKL